ncbi:MAG: MauE/DoxX family redox-associated membrane protein [Rhabdochlamydiaceae bacterium]
MKYWPLVTLILISALAGSALSPHFEMRSWMHYFMGFFLCQFAMLKLFHPAGFAEGFQKYDLIAMKFRLYAFIYPLIELGLGLGYLSFFAPYLIYVITVLVLGIGAVGVIKALFKGLDLRCACMGTVLDVPLSTVTLTEDLVMVAMALMLMLNL